MDKRNALLKLLMAFYFLYLALPSIREMTTPASSIFWAAWIVFFLLVAGANIGTLLDIKKRQSVNLEEYSENKRIFLKQN
ncbi:hypothetical protein [Virgibacillus sp. MSP4-1]|uniref:hypothetical protein n=1 Tax=Virgibacillus sp. MSP4-1 TaxID=2700081 RepID=UPI0007C85F49|nr:hypothetical protein [Virgibacillus sp. MSP4-1]